MKSKNATISNANNNEKKKEIIEAKQFHFQLNFQRYHFKFRKENSKIVNVYTYIIF